MWVTESADGRISRARAVGLFYFLWYGLVIPKALLSGQRIFKS